MDGTTARAPGRPRVNQPVALRVRSMLRRMLAVGAMIVVVTTTACTDHEAVLVGEGQDQVDDLTARIASPSCPDLVEDYPALDRMTSNLGWSFWCESFLEDVHLPTELTQVRAEVVHRDDGLIRSVSYEYWYRYERTDGAFGLLGLSLSASSGELTLDHLQLDTCRSARFCQL